MIEGVALCQPCRERSEVGEFNAGRNRMVGGLEKTGGHAASVKAATDYTYFQCRDCGQKWILSEDSSVRGPSRYLSRRRD